MLYEDFCWFNPDALKDKTVPGERVAAFASRTMDASRGAKLLMGILEQDEIDGECEELDGTPCPRLLSIHDAGVARRLCITVLEMLAEDADRLLDSLRNSGKGDRHG